MVPSRTRRRALDEAALKRMQSSLARIVHRETERQARGGEAVLDALTEGAIDD